MKLQSLLRRNLASYCLEGSVAVLMLLPAAICAQTDATKELMHRRRTPQTSV